MINYSIIGAGWRAEFYIRLAKICPDTFHLCGICIRNEEKAKELQNKYGINSVRTLEELKKIPCDFFVNCINKADISDLSLSLAEEGFAVLMETPACVNSKQAKEYAQRLRTHHRISVAEQFHLKPMYQTVKAIIDEGIIGNVCDMEISLCHEYHAMSLIRKFLDVDSIPKVTSTKISSPLLVTNGRGGELENKQVKTSERFVKIFDFGEKSALYHFDRSQYFSPIRTDSYVIHGTRGEIRDGVVRYFNQNNRFIQSNIIHNTSGNLDGFFNGTVTFENKVYYKSPFGDARLSDEETAIGEVLLRMDSFIKTGKQFYSFDEALKDVIFWNSESADF